LKKIYYFLLIFVSCKQNDDFKGGRVFEVTNNSNALNYKNDSLFDEETKIKLDSIKTSLLDSFANRNRIKIGPKITN